MRSANRFACVTNLVVMLAVAASMLLVPLTAAPAEAAIGDLTCTTVFQIDVRPALTALNTKGNASIVVGLSNCLSLNGRYSPLKAGLMTGSGPAQSLGGVPCNLLLTIAFTLQISWAN